MIEPGADPGPWWKRLMWLALIWAASVLALGILAFALRWWLI